MSANTNDQAVLSGVLQQAELVQYQTGSVVSRMLIKKPGGNVTAFAFDQNEGLSEHTAPFDALVLLIEGEADISVSQTVHRVGAGQMLLLPAGQPHALKAITKFKMILVMVKA
jgi:quercetin dioxygenase-like cupin family protein